MILLYALTALIVSMSVPTPRLAGTGAALGLACLVAALLLPLAAVVQQLEEAQGQDQDG